VDRLLRLSVVLMSTLQGAVGLAASSGLHWKPEPLAQPYRFINWALRPGGAGAVYVLEPAHGAAILLYQDFETGSLRRLSRSPDPCLQHASALQSADYAPTWSPDGSQLSYLQPQGDVSHLTLWRPRDGSFRTFARDACAATNLHGCKGGAYAWSPDSRLVFFLARTEGEAGDEVASTTPPSASLPDLSWRKLLYADPEAAGITVRTSKATNETGPLPRALLPNGIAADVVVADTQTGTVSEVLDCTNAESLAVAPDGQNLLAVARTARDGSVRQFYSDYYVVSIQDLTKLPFMGSAAPPTCRQPGEQSLRPLLHNVRQADGPAVWSPDARSIAFVEKGALASGDVFLADVGSGLLTDLTRAPLLPEPGEQREELAQVNRTDETPNSKFNDSHQLIWSQQGDALYAVRRTCFGSSWKTRLWRLPLSGRPTNLSAGESDDVALPIPGLQGPSPNDEPIVAPVERSDGRAALVSFSSSLSVPVVLAGIPGSARRSELQRDRYSAADGSAIFVAEGAYRAQEVFLAHRGSGELKQVTAVNAGLPRAEQLPTRERVTWRGADGESRFGYVYLAPGTRAPHALVVQIYPRDSQDAPLSGETYLDDPGHELFLPPIVDLLRAGYAVFKPDIPVAGRGKTCDDLAANVDLALEKINEMGLADGNRAAIFGLSFGGWAVNCVVTRSKRFRAAVSVAGFADLISEGFSPVSAAQQLAIGGGQVEIGKSVWEAPELYWHESPLSAVAAVTTPLLLIHGKLDNTAPVDQSVEMYTALARLGKEATLVTYDDATHASVLTLPDYNRRVIDWITERLGPP
jgi:dipeptidyl aminopeptidase/acylaminoacyl peptidase